MNILFYIVPILIAITFIFTIALIFSPKLRGKMMSKQIKATKHMLDYSKDDLQDLMTTSATIGIDTEKTILDKNEDTLRNNVIRKANINKEGIEITTKAIKDGLSSGKDNKNTKFCIECGKKIPTDAKFCLYCGKEQ